MTPLKKVREELQISEPTGVDWFNFIRDVCAEYFNQNPVEIGGPGIHVEIDESKFGRRKYNRGRWQEGHWVFGGIERITGKSFLVEVQKRDANTLLPIIMQYIRPGSVIYSDEWRAYSRLPTLPGQMYTHHTVNHSVNFVDPVTGAHTQMVERMWGGCKGMMRQQKTMHSRLFDTYLQEFMWRKQFDGFGQNAFCNIIQHISQQYPF
jgi:transposase-like protein